MFRGLIEDGKDFKKLFKPLKDFVNEAQVSLSDEGIKICAMDSAHVALVDLNLTPSYFKNIESTQPIVIGVNFANFEKILKIVDNGSSIEISAHAESDVLTIRISKEHSESIHAMKLINIEQDQLGIPEPEKCDSFEMDSKEFANTCTKLAFISDIIDIHVNSEGIEFGYDSDISKGGYAIDSSKESLTIHRSEYIFQRYGKKYIEMLCKWQTFSKRVVVYINDNGPLCVLFCIGDDSYIRFFIAPKVLDEKDIISIENNHKERIMNRKRKRDDDNSEQENKKQKV
jgi:proliferating cell nuclear antigen